MIPLRNPTWQDVIRKCVKDGATQEDMVLLATLMNPLIPEAKAKAKASSDGSDTSHKNGKVPVVKFRKDDQIITMVVPIGMEEEMERTGVKIEYC